MIFMGSRADIVSCEVDPNAMIEALEGESETEPVEE
jgi:hypothetical protein